MDKKVKQLEMSLGKANGILKKSIMYDLVKKLNLNYCFRCNLKINEIDEFSIEHKEPWQDSEKPINLFFDLNNIAFSHLICNIRASRKNSKIISPDGYNWCWSCKIFKDIKDFQPSYINQKRSCKICYSKYRKEYRKKYNKK